MCTDFVLLHSFCVASLVIALQPYLMGYCFELIRIQYISHIIITVCPCISVDLTVIS